MGIIPRIADDIFTHVESLKPSPAASSSTTPPIDQVQRVELRASFVEIYNEHLFDLLVPGAKGAITMQDQPNGEVALLGARAELLRSSADVVNVRPSVCAVCVCIETIHLCACSC